MKEKVKVVLEVELRAEDFVGKIEDFEGDGNQRKGKMPNVQARSTDKTRMVAAPAGTANKKDQDTKSETRNRVRKGETIRVTSRKCRKV